MLRSPQMYQSWLLMRWKIEINKDAGACPKLGGTADKHIRPCQIDDRDFMLLYDTDLVY